jgi:hypothetical protein
VCGFFLGLDNLNAEVDDFKPSKRGWDVDVVSDVGRGSEKINPWSDWSS